MAHGNMGFYIFILILIDELEKDKEWFDWLVWHCVDCLIIEGIVVNLFAQEWSLCMIYLLTRKNNQGCQYRTGGHTDLATGTIYFGYRSIPVYHFGFTAIFYIYKNIYICMYVCMCLCIYIIINIKVYHKTFPQFRTNYLWF